MIEIEQKLNTIRNWLTEQNLHAFIIPHDDEYMSEYLPPQNERLAWATGFTGSAGVAVITRDKASIFVDGRYTVQVKEQVPAEQFEILHLYDNPYMNWLKSNLPGKTGIGYDARLHTGFWLRSVSKSLTNGHSLIPIKENPIDVNWENRPSPKGDKAILLDEKFTGKSSAEKRNEIAKTLEKNKCDAAFITALDSICWLLNIRGNDVPCNPVLLSHVLINTKGDVKLFIDEEKIPDGFNVHVGDGVTKLPPEKLKDALLNLKGKTIGFDSTKGNAWAAELIKMGGAKVKNLTDPCSLPKACKNEVEAQGMRDCHIRDGVAVCRFLAWVDRQVNSGNLLDEGILSDKLESFRKDGKMFMGLSFDTISAAAGNAAMCHYNHTNQKTPGKLEQDSIYLVDSGGQYMDGTTDITRTISVGTPNADIKKAFTLVIKGHIALGQAVFPKGTSGQQLDPLARQFLWQNGMDYDHGTGHGVGHFLNVHEGPQGVGKKGSAVPLQEGMVISNEPGYYEADKFGFRCENLVLVVQSDSNGSLETLGFENLTMVPFDTKLLDLDLMTPSEMKWMNDYHQEVFDKISPHLSGEDLDWLKIQTRRI